MNDFKLFKQEKSVISVRLNTSLLNKVDKLSFVADISRNEVIVQCIEYAIKHLDVN